MMQVPLSRVLGPAANNSAEAGYGANLTKNVRDATFESFNSLWLIKLLDNM